MTLSPPCVIVFAHGARDPAWAAPLAQICQALRQGQPGLRVEQAFLELQEPRIGETLEHLANEGVTNITVLPVFVARGSHLRTDLPNLIAAAQELRPQLRITVLPPLGEINSVIRAVTDFALAALTPAPANPPPQTWEKQH